MENKLNVVLVHGAWGDAGHWRKVIPALVAKGYNVRAVQLSLNSTEENIQRTRTLVASLKGPTLLVGHSYGGVIISDVGNEENVVGLVYIAAFAPDEGEAPGQLLEKWPTPKGSLIANGDADGFFWLEFDKYHETFAPGTSDEEALVMSLTQKPIHGSSFGAVSGKPAWKTKPSWYQISAKDDMIQPELEAWFAERMNAKTITLDAGHASLASHGGEVAEFIIEAAESLSVGY
ncbi:alpha/beta hydrolase [Mucilaginibacter rigui]|uniref:Alpha/beta hydrolase n=1 Tax=Mucilaginibacter rigui TaxID=534635 RepID=A0ABR7X5X6_9SPHI|nr:alpha/beta hydrolase [Mucilaginibacter rigui]MBD1385906.1 alpha/beta hydrolase [Mucilaginibacter rigui]